MILIVGAEGQVGYELCRLSKENQIPFLGLTRNQLDVTNKAMIDRVLGEFEFDVLINAAAYNAVDRAEEERDVCESINSIAPENLAEFCHRKSKKIIHYSTDYVFDGESKSPYTELDPTAPLSVYGKSKLLGEQRLAASCRQHFIFRLSWVYSLRRHNFLKTIIRLASEKSKISVVDDQFGAPSFARQIARGTLECIKQMRAGSSSYGIYHMTPAGSVSWYEFTGHILKRLSERGMKVPHLEAISSSQYPSKVRRPKNSVMNSQKLLKSFGVKLGSWESGLNECFGDFEFK